MIFNKYTFLANSHYEHAYTAILLAMSMLSFRKSIKGTFIKTTRQWLKIALARLPDIVFLIHCIYLLFSINHHYMTRYRKIHMYNIYNIQ